MKILLIGSGAREHAIAKAIKCSTYSTEIICCANTRNPGIQSLASEYWVTDICDEKAIINTIHNKQIDFAIIGPEAPLEKGIADVLWQYSVPVIGPKKSLARVETSKAFARNLLEKYIIPGSPRYRVFNDMSSVLMFLQELGEGNYVIKANGLMGGKGVKVAGEHLHSFEEALQFCKEIFSSHQIVVIEEKLIGQEFSLLCFCDGNNLVMMPAVQDHKRAFENDEGPNTGGMGSYSDANHRLPFLTCEDIEAAYHINQQVIRALTKECGEKYIGILYGSFMATKEGVRLIEYNARLGDPEAMNVLSILETDFVEICHGMIKGNLSEELVRFAPKATVCKYAVPQGYPDQPLKNTLIDVSQVQNTEQLYFAAVNEDNGKLYATGSRAVAVVGIANTIAEAEKMAEIEIQKIQGLLYHRTDIGTEKLIRRRVKHMQELRSCAI